MTATVLNANQVRIAPLADGDDAQVDPGAIVVGWRHDGDGPIFQLYLDGELAAIATDPADREMIVATDAAALTAVAVIAVDPADAEVDHGRLLTPAGRGNRALLRWPRLNAADPGGRVDVFGNGGGGEIDFDAPLNRRPIVRVNEPADRWGLGLGGFGNGPFGWEGSTAPGLGMGAFGVGEFGFDAPWQTWLSEPLPPGEHRLVAVDHDRAGNAADASPEVTLTIHETPAGVASTVTAADGDTIELTWQNATD